MTDESDLTEAEVIQIRKAKLTELRANEKAYPTGIVRDDLAAVLLANHSDKSKEALAETKVTANVAGRMVLRRIMGKASFMHIQDVSGRLQLYVRKEDIGEDLYHQFKHWDLGDIIFAEGYLFITKTKELTLHVTQLKLLTKSLRPLPDKFHGLSDTELRYRQRYVDLIANEETRHAFVIRSKIIHAIRDFMNSRGYLEVETPMLHSIPGGAIARPFETYHNTLDMPMFLRIAPELFLKRCVIGGFERVYEINRNFRNEGVSTQHNPEFTMLEFYQAYATYEDMMNLTEALFQYLSERVMDSKLITYQDHTFDFSQPFTRMTMTASIKQFNPEITDEDLADINKLTPIAKKLGIQIKDTYGLGKIQLEIFEKTVEDKLIQPTFITEYPTEVSPLARCNDKNPFITDRFEFFLAGREIANGFSELNDPQEQADRFHKQVEEKDAGDDEAMHFDQDYIRALEYGMPPTAGQGIGIDRLVMIFTNSPSIRDVILFPHMRLGVNHG